VTLFDHFDRIRIVNLAHRRDRRAEMERQLAKAGLADDPRVEFFAAVATTEKGPFWRSGDYGCFLSHLAILQDAADAGESVLILEDDCDFVLPDVLAFQMPDSCDIFYGGYLEASDPANLAESNIIGSHFMGFSAATVKTLADYLVRYLQPDFPPDPRAAAEPDYNPAIRPSIDGAYVWFRRAHPELATVFTQLGVQRPSRTDIGAHRWFDRTPIIRDLAGWTRKALRYQAAALAFY
jgi:glycosyl transferase family 25